MQILFEALVGKRLKINVKIDNTQALAAVKRGYSKKLRHLPRTQKVSIGVIHDILQDPECMTNATHCGTADMKADIFTKSLTAAPFVKAVNMIGMVRR